VHNLLIEIRSNITYAKEDGSMKEFVEIVFLTLRSKYTMNGLSGVTREGEVLPQRVTVAREDLPKIIKTLEVLIDES
jgi:hypothetical protein